MFIVSTKYIFGKNCKIKSKNRKESNIKKCIIKLCYYTTGSVITQRGLLLGIAMQSKKQRVL